MVVLFGPLMMKLTMLHLLKLLVCVSGGVRPPPCVAVAASRAHVTNPDADSTIPVSGGYAPRLLQLKCMCVLPIVVLTEVNLAVTNCH